MNDYWIKMQSHPQGRGAPRPCDEQGRDAGGAGAYCIRPNQKIAAYQQGGREGRPYKNNTKNN